MRNLTFVYDEKTQEYRCDKNGEIFTYIYKRYEPNNPRKRRYCYMVKGVIFYSIRDAKDYVKLLYDLSESPSKP